MAPQCVEPSQLLPTSRADGPIHSLRLDFYGACCRDTLRGSGRGRPFLWFGEPLFRFHTGCFSFGIFLPNGHYTGRRKDPWMDDAFTGDICHHLRLGVAAVVYLEEALPTVPS